MISNHSGQRISAGTRHRSLATFLCCPPSSLYTDHCRLITDYWCRHGEGRPSFDLTKRPQPRRHRPHRRRQDHHHRAPALLRRGQAQARRRRRGHHRDRLRPRGAGARHHHLLGLRPVRVARLHRQPDRHARPRRFHRRGRAVACASSTARSSSSTPRRASRPSRRRSGGRPTSTACRGWCSSTRWTSSGPTSPDARSIHDRLTRDSGARPAGAVVIPIGAGSVKDSPHAVRAASST